MGHFPLRPPNRERLALRKGVLEVPSSRAAMAQAVASMVGLRGSSQAVLEGKLHLTGSTRLGGAAVARPAAVSARRGVVRAQLPDAAEPMAPAGRRAILGITAAALTTGCLVQGVLADAQSIKVGPPPPPSGGLPGTLNSDQARDLELKLKDRFYLQPLAPADAAARAKESANAIINVKALIDKKAWPYVQNDLRSKASYLRYDLNTIISSKSKDEKKALKELTKILFEKIDALDYAAKTKNAKNAEKYYAETKASLDDVLAKIG